MLLLLFVLLCAYAFFQFLQPGLPDGNRLLHVLLSVLFSQVLLSFVYTFSLFSRWPLPLVAGLTLVIIAVWIFYQWKRKPAVTAGLPQRRLSLLLLAVLLLCLYDFTADFLAQSKVWGEWDNFAIWSMHAKFLMDPDAFRQLFSGAFSRSHPDYPLFLPALTAAYWQVTGVSPEVPFFLAYGAAIFILLICFLYFYDKKQPVWGIIAVLLLCGRQILLPVAAFQYADVWLGLFLLLSIVFFTWVGATSRWQNTLLLGFCVACCGWIKNEGLVFVLWFSLLFLFRFYRNKKLLIRYAAGLLLPLCFILYFKYNFAPEGDLFVKGPQDAWQKLQDGARYQLLWQYIIEFLSSRTPLLLYLLLATLLFCPRYFISFPFLALLGLFASYLLIYLITPNDLEWHMASSFDRLLHQLMPATVFSVVLFFSREYGLKDLWGINSATQP